MKNVAIILILISLGFSVKAQDTNRLTVSIKSTSIEDVQYSTIERQLTNSRVANAKTKYYDYVKMLFQNKNINFPCSNIFWRAFKWNKSMELWAYSPDSQRFVLITDFPICETIGDLGPKRHQGDFQIPEGFYYIDKLNPNSNYHLSLHVNYPNTSDSILGNYHNLGGDIYIHGGCETIGCLPMTDDLIEQIYLINLYAMSNGQTRIPIHIFPVKLTTNNFNKLKETYFAGNVENIKFWLDLKRGYDFFESSRRIPNISVNYLSGKYLINGN